MIFPGNRVCQFSLSNNPSEEKKERKKKKKKKGEVMKSVAGR